MKKIVLTLALSAMAGVAFGQGVVTVNTAKADAWVQYTNTVTRAWATGTDVVWGLYSGADEGSASLIYFAGANGFYSGATATLFGTIANSGAKTINSLTPGNSTTFYLKAWSSGYATYELAKASGDPAVLIAKTIPTATATPSSPAGSPPPTPPTILWNPGSTTAAGHMIVELVPVPEPSIIALAGLGLAGLIFIRRRK